jgi:hypothetical protein
MGVSTVWRELPAHKNARKALKANVEAVSAEAEALAKVDHCLK